jgi:hypothetical protein
MEVTQSEPKRRQRRKKKYFVKLSTHDELHHISRQRFEELLMATLIEIPDASRPRCGAPVNGVRARLLDDGQLAIYQAGPVGPGIQSSWRIAEQMAIYDIQHAVWATEDERTRWIQEQYSDVVAESNAIVIGASLNG